MFSWMKWAMKHHHHRHHHQPLAATTKPNEQKKTSTPRQTAQFQCATVRQQFYVKMLKRYHVILLLWAASFWFGLLLRTHTSVPYCANLITEHHLLWLSHTLTLHSIWLRMLCVRIHDNITIMRWLWCAIAFFTSSKKIIIKWISCSSPRKCNRCFSLSLPQKNDNNVEWKKRTDWSEFNTKFHVLVN